jgi:hypothetical protein
VNLAHDLLPACSSVRVGGVRYLRIVVGTRWLTPGDELAEVLPTSVRGVALPGDTVVVSEKVACC